MIHQMRSALKLTTALVAVTIALPLATASAAPVEATTHYIYIDRSASTPIATDKAFALKAGNLAYDRIMRNVMLGDTLTLISVGERGGRNMLTKTYHLNARLRQAAVAGQVRAIIASTPNSQTSRQNATDLLFMLENTDIRCNARTTITLFTDGKQASSDFDRMDEVISGKVGLPPPPSAAFQHCAKITMVGTGIASDPKDQIGTIAMRRLKDGWNIYFRSGASPAKVEHIVTY